MNNAINLNLEANKLSISQFLSGPNNFEIPVFQRNYAWTPRNCEQLYNDLIKIKDEPDKIHFFGSIVSVSSTNGIESNFQIIDGQQRIMTTTLLILAMYKSITHRIISSNNSNLEQYLYSYLYGVSKKPKLHPNKKDQKAFENLLDETAEYDKSSNLTTNFNFFYEHIQEAKITIDDLFTAISRLVIVNITLLNGGNPQLVFESLNSTGLDLTESDKVKNFLLMNLSPEDQEKYYNTYWEKIEANTDDYLDEFIRDYLSVKLSKTPKKDKVYFEFKKYAIEKNLQLNELLVDLRTYSRSYKELLRDENPGGNRLDACIYRLNKLETKVARPFFLEVFRIQEEGKITEEEKFQIFQYVENYICRRSVCELPTNALNKIFPKLHKDIERIDGTLDNYFEKFKCILLNKQDKARFPDDEEFRIGFSKSPIYKKTNKRDYIFERLENNGNNEDKDVYRHLDSDDKKDKYEIEHIMPQTLTDTWKKELGSDFEAIHKTWIDRAANLTLTAYNPNLSNLSFKEKCDLKNGGYRDCGIRMSQRIATQYTKWGKSELEKRDKELTDAALEIWERPQTDYEPPKEEFRTYTLEDDDDMTGKTIIKFVYKGCIGESVNGWTDMYKKVLSHLHSENNAILYRLSQKKGKKPDISKYFNDVPFANRSFGIGANLYGQSPTTNTTAKLRILRQLFDMFKVDYEDLEFHIKNEDKKGNRKSS